MKLLDKFKDLFMDDIVEEDEVDALEDKEEEKVYQEPKKDVLPKVMREEITEEEKFSLPKEKPVIIQNNNDNTNREVKKENNENTKKFNFVFDFDEVPTRESKNVELTKMEPLKQTRVETKTEKEPVKEKKKSDLYPAKEENWVKPKFKASPVISPVYGVLDKNYKKEEVKEKLEEKSSMKRPSKKVDFETVRKKAFGNLSDDIRDSMCENCELYKEALKNNMIEEDNLLYDMTIDDTKKEETIEKAYSNYEEFGVAYEPKVEKVTEEIEKEEVEVNKVEDVIEETKEDNVVPSRSKIKEEDTKVDDDFFKLIDSMYKERNDD